MNSVLQIQNEMLSSDCDHSNNSLSKKGAITDLPDDSMNQDSTGWLEEPRSFSRFENQFTFVIVFTSFY